jgi:hypothetical protein
MFWIADATACLTRKPKSFCRGLAMMMLEATTQALRDLDLGLNSFDPTNDPVWQ